MGRLFPAPSEAGSTFSSLTPAGIELDHFRIEERIGLGGMGAVFRAVDTRLQRHVALKLLAPSQSYDDSSIKRFQNEARAAARLDHENIARVYYIGEERGLHFIAFEYVTGSNIRDMIRSEGRLSPADAVNYALQIAYALKHTAAMGVVHRDIKPSNVIITPTGRAKLVDLGLARKDSTESQGDLTLPGTTLGTFDYISPEQAKDPRSVDVRSDIYSLGCTMYHMLTGQPPYPEGTVLQKLLDHQGKEAPDPAAINPRVPEQLSAVVRKMMNSDRNRRYQTPELLIRDLSYVAATLGLRGANPEGLVWVASKAVEPGGISRHVGWLATVAILFGVVGLLSAFPQLGRDSVIPRQVQPNELTVDLNSGGGATEETTPGSTIAASDTAPPPGLSEPSLNGAGPEVGSSSTASNTAVRPAVTVVDGGNNTPTAVGLPLRTGEDAEVGPTLPTASQAGRSGNAPQTATQPDSTNAARTGSDSTSDTTVRTQPADGSSKPKPTDMAAVVSADTEYPVTLFSSDSRQEESYRTLESACAAATDGSTIELRFNGTLRERSFRITRKNITVRAAKGFRPVIEFEPTDLDSTDASVRMISVAGGPLHIINVEFRMLIPNDAAADRYSLFGIGRNETVQLDQVTATFENPARRPAAMFETFSDPSQMPPDATAMPVTTGRSSALIDLRNCFIRGEAILARLAIAGRFEANVENSVAALDGLFHVTPPGMPVSERPSIVISFDHVSALLRGSLLRLSGPVSVDGPTIALQPRNCILTSAPDTPLIAADADIPSDEVRRMLVWRGQRNFYDRLETYLSVAAAEEIYGFEEWRQYWGSALEVGPWSGTLNWSAAVRPSGLMSDDFSDVPLDAFQLAALESEDNPAIDGATDGNDAGADLTMLVAPWRPRPVTVDRKSASGPVTVSDAEGEESSSRSPD
jgi:serine/threonine protein kinase